MSKPTPGPWGVYYQPVADKEAAKQELSRLVDGTDFRPVLPMVVGSNGLCTAVTGCGPTSVENARLIALAPAMLDALIDLHSVARVDRDEDYRAVASAAAVILAATGGQP